MIDAACSRCLYKGLLFKDFLLHSGDALGSTGAKWLLLIVFCAFKIAFNLFPCQSVTVSRWPVCLFFSIRLHPSILTAVHRTMRPNQFFTHPVCQSFCLRLFTLSPCLSLYLCFSQSIYQSVCPFAHEEMDIWLCSHSTSWFAPAVVHLSVHPFQVEVCLGGFFGCRERWIFCALTPVIPVLRSNFIMQFCLFK